MYGALSYLIDECEIITELFLGELGAHLDAKVVRAPKRRVYSQVSGEVSSKVRRARDYPLYFSLCLLW